MKNNKSNTTGQTKEVEKINLERHDFTLQRLDAKREKALELAINEVGISKTEFPKHRVKFKTEYKYKKTPLFLTNSNDKEDTYQINNGVLGFLLSAIDFSFVRDILAPKYSKYGNPECYDPTSLFLFSLAYSFHQYSKQLHFYRLLSGKSGYAKQIKELLGFVNPDDNEKTSTYNKVKKDSQIKDEIEKSKEAFPSLSVISEFVRDKLTPDVMTKIFAVINAFFIHWLNLQDVRFRITFGDGCAFADQSRYRGCNKYDVNLCSKAIFNLKDFGADLRRQLSETPDKLKFNTDFSFSIQCPFKAKWEKEVDKGKSSPSFQIFKYKFIKVNEPYYQSTPNSNDVKEVIPYILGITDILNKYSCKMEISNCKIYSIVDEQNCSIYCPKIPSDNASRMSVKRSNINSSEKVFIFGYNLIILSAFYPMLNLELPIAFVVIEGNADEGKKVETLIKQLKELRKLKQGEMKVTILDSKYDEDENYLNIRNNGSIPVIDYNLRGETFPKEIKATDNRKIFITKNFLPLCPKGIEMKPNGHENKSNRNCYSCSFECSNYLLNPHTDCSYLKNHSPFETKIKVYPDSRDMIEVVRSSETHSKLKSIRSGSERLNANGKELGLHSKKYMCANTNRAKGGFFSIAILTKKVYNFIINNQVIFNETKNNLNNRTFADYLFDPIHPLLQKYFIDIYKTTTISVPIEPSRSPPKK